MLSALIRRWSPSACNAEDVNSPWPANPVVHEIFTWVWLEDLGRTIGRRVTLANVPDGVWDDVARPGIDAVWLMGVWSRSPVGAKIARANPAMRRAHLSVLPDLTDVDVVGSAYCIRSYHVDDHLGGDAALAIARAALAIRGVRLVLDLVPNHVAPDHPWVTTHPEWFIHGNDEDLDRQPDGFLRLGEHVLACGRDPNFPAWPEVVQLDASHVGLRAAMADLAASLTSHCDGLRCDMAMLVLDDVFRRTWGVRASGGGSPDGGRGFWPTVITAAKAADPDFMMWAEAYWDLEPVLLEQGFDACYDKRFYDRIIHHGSVAEIRHHLTASVDELRHAIRFVENHDELRAAAVLPRAAHLAALTTVLTVPGVALLHEGEADGRATRVPVTLGRRPVESPDTVLSADVARLVHALASGLRRGTWELVDVDGWPDNASAERLLAWAWTSDEQRHLVVVNLSDRSADGRVRLPWTDLVGTGVVLHDLLSVEDYERDGDAMLADGLYVALDAFGVHLFRVD